MNTHKFLTVMRLLLVLVALGWVVDECRAEQATGGEITPAGTPGRMRSITPAQRQAAAARAAARRKAAATQGQQRTMVLGQPAAVSLAVPATPSGADLYFGIYPNYANSPLPTLDGNGNPVPGTGIRKFIDSLPGFCGVSAPNGLGQCLPLATPFANPPAGVPRDGDYYEIGLSDYNQKLHGDLPATKIRGYSDLNPAGYTGHQYLGPVILATKNRPVRIKFKNLLPISTDPASKLFIPVDTTMRGAGAGPDGSMYPQNRAAVHLHGGNTPWISDGTPHQWITPAGDPATLNRGASQRNVPDMPDPGPGAASYYWTNQQGGRLMFYHDHAYGLARISHEEIEKGCHFMA